MEFIVSLKLGIQPDHDREFFELNWFYERYIAYQKELEQQQSLQM